MKTAQVEKMHSRTTPIDTIAAMKPLRDIWWQLQNKNQILVKKAKNKIDITINLKKIRHLGQNLILIAQNVAF